MAIQFFYILMFHTDQNPVMPFPINKKLMALLSYLSLTCSGFTQDGLPPALASLTNQATIALIVSDLHHPEQPLWSHHAQIYLQPASSLKVLTAIIAQTSLPEKSPFTSYMRAFGKQKKHVFHGNIDLELGGNPSFQDTDLIAWVNYLKQKNIRLINGNIYIRKTHFDAIEHIPGTIWDEQDDCYAAAVSDISLNKNCFILTLLNTGEHITQYNSQLHQPIQLNIELRDQCPDQTIANSHFPTYGYGIWLKQNPFQKPESLSGCWSKNIPYWQLKRSLHHPDQILKANLADLLKAEGIQYQQIIISDQPNASTRPLLWTHTHNSAPLSSLIQTMLMESDNHIANQLFKQAAYHNSQQKTSWEDAQAHAQHTLKQLNLADPGSNIVDGAGLSRNNRITAQQLHKALITIYQNPKLKPLIQRFAHANGEKSTLSKRILQIEPVIYAKTGSLNGVSALVGYIDPFGQHPKAFTLMINGNKQVHKDYLKQEPSLLKQIASANTSIYIPTSNSPQGKR